MSVVTDAIDPTLKADGKLPGLPRDIVPMPGRGQYPRMLNLSEEIEDRLRLWLQEEISQCLLERDQLVLDWEQWQTDYWAVPAEKVKNFPFERAANIIVPLTAIAVEAVFSRIFNIIFSVEPFWSIRPRTLAWADAAPNIEKWLQAEVENPRSLDMHHFASQSLMEFVKLGTGVGKTGYVRELKKSLRTLPDGSEESVWVEVRNGPVVDYVPLANFLLRLKESDPQTAAWCGEEHEFSWSQIKRMALSGRYDPKEVEKLRAYWASQQASAMESGSAQSYHATTDDLLNQDPTWNDKFLIQEIWCSFDVDDDGVEEEIVIDFHRMSGAFLAIRYNWFQDCRRPYRGGQFIPVEGRFYGLGIGKQNEQFQEEITTIHRQRLDNATLANMRMIAVKRGLGYSTDEPIYPGKIWFVNDHRDIYPIQMSEVYPSSYANEESILRFSEKRTGVNEVLLGQPHEGTPGTATDMLTRLAEGNKKYDMVLKNVRRWYGLIGTDVIATYQQFGDQGRHWMVLDEKKGAWVEQFLQFPQELISQGAVVDLNITDSSTNRQVEQQQWMALFRLITEYYQSVITLSQILQNPQITATLAQRALSASDFAAKRLFESFQIVDYEPLLLTEEERTNAQPPVPGPVGGPPTPTQPSGLEGAVGLPAAPVGGGFTGNGRFQ